MTDNANPTPKELLQQIRSFIAVSKEHVAAGGEVELSGLDDKVKELCEAVLDMPKAEADKYTAALQELADDLTRLKTDMETVQKDVRQQLDALNLRQKAAKAYTTTEAVDKGNKPPQKPEE